MNDTEGKNTTYKNITIKTLQNELFKVHELYRL